MRLHQKSARTLQYTVSELDAAVSKAWFAIKRNLEDADGDAIVLLTITTGLTGSGQITTAGGVGTPAVLKFYVGETALDAVSAGVKLWAVVKVYSNSKASVVPDSIEPVEVLGAGVVAIS